MQMTAHVDTTDGDGQGDACEEGDDDDETPWDERDESQMPSLLPVDEAVWA